MEAITKYKVALQQNKQTEIWIKLSNTINELFDGDIRKLFKIKASHKLGVIDDNILQCGYGVEMVS